MPPVADPVSGLAPGTAAVEDPLDPRTAGQVAPTADVVRAASQSGPAICSQLVFQPLIPGCQALLGPISGRGLAPTGTPLLIGLLGALLISVGGLINWRSRRPDAQQKSRTARADA